MKKQTLLQECLLTAAAIAVPSLCLAADHAPLQPVNVVSSLKAVPDTAPQTAIQLAQFQSQTGEGMLSAPQTGIQTRTITLVQHDTSAGNPDEPKKPGFLRRLFGKRSGGEDDSSNVTQVSPGQPGTPIPKPPPIDFTMPGQTPKSSSGVPSRTASFHSSSLPTYQAAHSKDSTLQSVPVEQSDSQGTSRSPQHSPARTPASRDGFVSPFVEESPQATDALLDLDSLIQDHQPVATGRRNVADSISETAEQLMPEANETMRVIAAKKNPQPETAEQQRAFTGIELPSDDEVRGLQATAPKKPLSKAAVSVETQAESIVQVPLMEEPATPLPTVAANRLREEFQLPVSEETFIKPALIDPVERKPTAEAAAFRPAETRSQEPVAPSFVEEPGDMTPAQSVADSHARREQQRYRIMSRTGKAGFKGFCPVALRDDQDLLDSREQFKARFGLQTYYFSSTEAKLAFESDPVRYAPAGGGNDVVLLVNTGEGTPGSLDFCLWYRDRLYMFRSRETQAMFSKDPRRYADQY